MLKKFSESKDFIDVNIHNIAFTFMNSSLSSIVDGWCTSNYKKEKESERMLKTILTMMQSLLKANSHLRKYRQLTTKTIEKIKRESMSTGTKTPVLGFTEIETISEVDACLAQLKIALDLFAKSINPILNSKFDGFHKSKNLNGKSIVDFIENSLNKEKQQIFDEFKIYLSENLEYITSVVDLRDEVIHPKKGDILTDFYYDPVKGEVITPKIKLAEADIEYIDILLERIIINVIDFIHTCLFLLVRKLGKGLEMFLDENSQPVWVITNQESI